MPKCFCYKCDFAVIRKWKRKSRSTKQIFFALQIHCKETNTDIINDEQPDEKLFFTEFIIEMECNRFKEKSKPIPFKGEISKKLVREAEEEAKKRKSKDS
ncbi:unnamed protein product [marine sediment metagenome]|uniref:Uncharacterized protein n=1 Tax=marine sediment metagenome TaxID=412755 RepID=X1CWL2_9ZZZZ